MFLDVPDCSLFVGEAQVAIEGPAAFWLSPTDDSAATEWLRTHFGSRSGWDGLGEGWCGAFEMAYLEPTAALGGVDGKMGAIQIDGRRYPVFIDLANIERAPAVFGVARFGESVFDDGRGFRALVLRGVGTAPSALSTDRGGQSTRDAVDTVARTDSLDIQRASLDVVQRVAERIADDANNSDAERAVARSVGASLDVLREHLDGHIERNVAEQALAYLRLLGPALAKQVALKVLIDLGVTIVKNLPT